MTEHVKVSCENHILQIRLNRPDRNNALTMAMYNTMSAAIEAAESDSEVRAIVLLASGDNFTVGNDLKDFPDPVTGDEATPPMRFITSLAQASVPIVAAVEGMAVGIGATMLLHLDSVVVADNASILMPFINIALVPEGGSSLMLPRLLGYTRAAELLLRGKPVSGQRAYELGIASGLARPGMAADVALGIAAEFAQKPPAVVRQTKRLLKGDREQIMQRVRDEEQLLLKCFASPEHGEAMSAFAEKRQPDFSRFS